MLSFIPTFKVQNIEFIIKIYLSDESGKIGFCFFGAREAAT